MSANTGTYSGKYMCCKPVLFKHEDGWDAYPLEDCVLLPKPDLSGFQWTIAFFDNPLVEDVASRAEVYKTLKADHPFGICMSR